MKPRTFLRIVIPFVLITAVTLVFFVLTGKATTNIDSTNHWAWSDTAGWWDFYGTDSVMVAGQELHGYASSSVGDMALNCDSTRNGNICGSSNFRVTNIDATGSLAGCAWNDTIGWIYFWCGDGDCDGSGVEDASSTCSGDNDHQVTIDANGLFGGYAWNDVEGWISFNCDNNSSCGSSDYKVESTWRSGKKIGYLESSIVDTEEINGVNLQSVIWQGSQPGGTSVDFQFAVSNSQSGPWDYKGPGGGSESWYGAECPIVGASSVGAGQNKAICTDKNLTAGYRYMRYKIRMQSNLVQDRTPQVENVILNWSN